MIIGKLTIIDKSEQANSDIVGNVDIVKKDEHQQLVFGWFNISTTKGNEVVDLQYDIIPSGVLEKAAYEYVLRSRTADIDHNYKTVGRLVESCYFSKAKQELLGVDLGKEGWWGGFFIEDRNIFNDVILGKYNMFSIGGTCKYE